MAAAIVSLAALVVMMPNVVSVTPLEGGESVAVSGALTFGNVGTQAMFAGVIIGLIATELFCMDLRDQKAADRPGRQHPAVCWKII